MTLIGYRDSHYSVLCQNKTKFCLR